MAKKVNELNAKRGRKRNTITENDDKIIVKKECDGFYSVQHEETGETTEVTDGVTQQDNPNDEAQETTEATDCITQQDSPNDEAQETTDDTDGATQQDNPNDEAQETTDDTDDNVSVKYEDMPTPQLEEIYHKMFHDLPIICKVLNSRTDSTRYLQEKERLKNRKR